MKFACGARADADHKASTFGYGVHQIVNNPRGSFMFGRVRFVGKIGAQRINYEPWRIGCLLASRNHTFGGVVVAVVADATVTEHDIGLELTELQDGFWLLRLYR